MKRNNQIKNGIIVVCLLGIVTCLLLLIPQFRQVIIITAELFLGRKLQDHSKWHAVLLGNSLYSILFIFLLGFIKLSFLRAENHENNGKFNTLYSKKLIKKLTSDEFYDDYIYLLMAIIVFLFLVKYSGYKSLWSDDIAQIQFTHKGLSLKEMWHRLFIETMPPLFSIITAIWLRIAPYGTAWLKIPSEIAVAVGIFLCGKIGKKITKGNTVCGVLCILVAAGSVILFFQAAYSFRPYGFLFLFSSLALYAYLKRFDELGEEKRPAIICYGIALTLLVYTHYFGVLVCASLFLADVFLFILGKIRKSCIFSYLITGVLFAPWFFLNVVSTLMKDIPTFWPAVPDFGSIIYIFGYLCSNNFYQTAAIILFSVIIAGIFSHNRDWKNFPYLLFIWCPIFVIGVVYIYSTIINPRRSLFVDRYFISVMPFFLVPAGIGFNIFCDAFYRIFNKKNVFVAFCIFFIFYFTIPAWRQFTWENNWLRPLESIEQVSEWLMEQNDIHNDNVLVVHTTKWGEGWDYYLTHNWTCEGIYKKRLIDFTVDDSQRYEKIYFVEIHHESTQPDFLPMYTLLTDEYQKVTKVEPPELCITVYERN